MISLVKRSRFSGLDHDRLDLVPVRLQVGRVRSHHLVEVRHEVDPERVLDLRVDVLDPAYGLLFFDQLDRCHLTPSS